MRIEFDAPKDAANREKHGMSLEVGGTIVANAVQTVMDARFDYGEDRFVAFGYLGPRLYVCVYTVRGDAVRIISVRKASDREVSRFGR